MHFDILSQEGIRTNDGNSHSIGGVSSWSKLMIMTTMMMMMMMRDMDSKTKFNLFFTFSHTVCTEVKRAQKSKEAHEMEIYIFRHSYMRVSLTSTKSVNHRWVENNEKEKITRYVCLFVDQLIIGALKNLHRKARFW